MLDLIFLIILSMEIGAYIILFVMNGRYLMDKCEFPEGIVLKPDGVNELDPCVYEMSEKYANVTVEILKCKKCGHVEIMWHRQDDTEELDE